MPPAEYLEVASIDLYGWMEITDLSPLWDGADVNGDDLHIPGSLNGQRELAQFLEPLVGVMPAVFYGDVALDGSPVDGDAECRQNLYENIAYFRENVCVPLGTLPSTRACVLHLPDGTSTLTGDIRISRRLDLRQLDGGSPFHLEASLAFKVVAGELAEAGS